MIPSSRLWLLPFLFTHSFAVILTQTTQIKPNSVYDYIIVGAGTAGLVVASRLTENSSISVLVLEAGVSNQGGIATEAPFLAPTLTPNTQYDWNYTVVPQAGLNSRTFSYPRGHVLGGTSSANYLIHQYGTDEDWNRLSSVTGDAGWAWNNMKQYVQKHEKFVPPVDGHNTTGQFIPTLHGFNGVVSVSLPASAQPIDSRVIATTQELAEFPFNQDTSGGDHSLLGIGYLQSSAGGGVRSSSATSYLALANGRPNLTVLINAFVTKLVQTPATTSGTKAFRSVQFTSSPGTGLTPAVTVNARRDVILSAGTVGTPHILQLSGIGNQADLKAVNITTIINNPSIGSNLTDHVLLPNIFNVQGTQSFDGILRAPAQVQANVNQWSTKKTGLFANNVANHYGFARLPSNATIFRNNTDPAPGSRSPHWEMLIGNFWFNPGVDRPPTGSFLSIVTALVSPTSRGTIKLRSSNPFDKPLVDPRHLTTEFDIFTMRETVKAIQRFVAAPAWAGYVTSPFGTAFSAAKTDPLIDTYVRGLASSLFHPVGTASMASKSSTTGVVNPDLTVKGTEGLRVVDASIFPFVPSCHPQGPVYLLAERASDIIKAAQK
ncbi:hypothetical protein GALMADRAFT_61126 [Galerina marginata CBS 339.88]|uniref:pyranose dehydrogenase (acceptor) n=1 Tax=Galerina marginata (strain CBS 339.88) TaxID=685588 RepID=A0A067TDE2_GALM3|nr:hypothetical protein GALMADRAFT_61126 [Galerina marginata CBS 339.88]